MAAYYNEIDKYAAQWLRNLITAGHIAPGDVDERSIEDVKPDDLLGYTQCHFFAGIGGWSIALKLADWPDDRAVWTGSCPCQPFSVAGKGGGNTDKRHLWPAWFRLIANVRPGVVFGEQVAGAIAHGWLDDAFDDLEREGYQTGAAVLPACSVGAPHKRDRLWFVANTESRGGNGPLLKSERQNLSTSIRSSENTSVMDNAKRFECEGELFRPDKESTADRSWASSEFTGCCETVADTYSGNAQREQSRCDDTKIGKEQEKRQAGLCGGEGHWNIEPAVGRVANGILARAHKLRAYGNAIVPQLAAEFIKASMECL